MKKHFIIVGGANGSGKTTFAYQYKEEYGIDYLGADEIAHRLSEKENGNIELKAGKAFFRQMSDYLSRKKSVIVESTLSGRGLEGKIRDFKEKGYAVHIVYVFLGSVALCKKRVRMRVKKGGHDVPEAEIERRYKRSIINFRQLYMPLADTWQLLYNNLSRPIEVAYGEEGNTIIVDDEYYAVFQEIISE